MRLKDEVPELKLGARLLFRPNYFARRAQRLPDLAMACVREEFAMHGPVDDEHLRASLMTGLELEPLEVGDPISFRSELFRRSFRNEYGVITDGYRAEVTIPYSGTADLWQCRPADDLEFRYRGIVRASSVTVRTMLDMPDVDPLLEWLNKDLPRAREALNVLVPRIVMSGLSLKEWVPSFLLAAQEKILILRRAAEA